MPRPLLGAAASTPLDPQKSVRLYSLVSVPRDVRRVQAGGRSVAGTAGALKCPIDDVCESVTPR